MSLPVAFAALLIGGSLISGLLMGLDSPTPPPDTGAADTGALDTGALDTGALDTGVVDTGTVDTGTVDTGTVDTGGADGGGGDGAADGGADGGADGAADGGEDTSPPVEIDTEVGDFEEGVGASPKFVPTETGCGSDEESAAGLLLVGFAGLVGLGRRRRQRA